MAGFARYFYTRQSVSLKLLKFSFSKNVSINSRSYTSALYVPGKLAHKTFALLTPDLDFDERFSDLEKLQKEFNSRGLAVDAKELKKTWDYYQYVVLNKEMLQLKMGKINAQIKSRLNPNKHNLTADNQEKEIQVLMTQAKALKEDIKALKEANWELEETVVPQLLKIPNEIDERTPLDVPVVLKSIGEKPNVPDSKKQSHLDIGKNLNLLDYRNPIQCYLCNNAVSFELGIVNLAGKLLSDSQAIRFSCPDFARSLLVEGCGLDHESPRETFMLQNIDDVEQEFLINRLHLVGGASLPALLAMFTKQMVRPKYLPMKVFTTGRQYTPFPSTPANYGLFTACQANAVQALTLLKSKNKEDVEEPKNEFQNLIDLTSRIYDDIGCHYRIVLRSAKELGLSESMKVSFEMWSAYSNQYIEVGNVSACGEYFSKRLMIGYQGQHKHMYTSIVTGTLLSVPRILGCLIEQDPEKFVLPNKLKEFTI